MLGRDKNQDLEDVFNQRYNANINNIDEVRKQEINSIDNLFGRKITNDKIKRYNPLDNASKKANNLMKNMDDNYNAYKKGEVNSFINKYK